ncbi:hypothetical protein [Haladaptatus caseinilyticus]|uniref:hypothetical protein n=1 Tax=Haladaptatus caseinilyticus TaxID=2993314 RepID=UPI00224A7EF0|nr:hypothetical protein [Haladaptatus caseinilyticus]
MDRQRFTAIAVVVVVLFAGCSGLGPSEGSKTTTGTTTTAQMTTDTVEKTTTEGTTIGSSTTFASETTATSTTSSDSWSKPTPPNTPLQNKMADEDREQGRIKSVELVDKTEASSGGYSDFDLKINADTRMKNIDPSDHGSVRGEPYFLVYVDGSLDNGSRFTRTDGTLIERSQEVSQNENGEYTIDVRPGGLKKTETEDGEVTILILLMDEDKDWDDIYGVKKITVDYSAEA